MKRSLVIALALALTGCATYINPVTGEQEVRMTDEGVSLVAGAVAVGAAAALANQSARRPAYRSETCNRRGCTTTRVWRY
jgi:starvation-inducible outer membrane lipoprotein